MQLKQITLASCFFFSSYLFGATYIPLDLRPFDSSISFNSINSILQPESTRIEEVKRQLTKEYFKARYLLTSGQTRLAVDQINQLIQKYPQESDFYNLRAVSDLLKKDYTSGIKNYQKAIQLSPENISSHMGLAIVYLQSGDNAQAENAANRALSIDNESVPAHLVLADVTYKGANPQETEGLLIRAQSLAKGNSEQEIKIANMLISYYLLQKQPQKALTVAQNTIEHYPNDSLALSILAKTQIYNKQEAEAIATLEKFIKQEAADAPHRILLAKLLLKHPEKQQEILKLLDESSTILPDTAQLHAQKTVILTELKLFPQALLVSKKVKTLAPESGLAEALEGDIYLADKKPDQALVAFQQSYQIQPSAEALASMTKIMMAQGKQSAVISLLEQEIKKDPNNIVGYLLAGDIYLQQNQTGEAEKHYLAVLVKQPENVSALNNLAWIYHQENNPKALELIEKAYNMAPDSADILDTYGAILVKQGNVMKGIDMYVQASKIDPLNYNTQYYLAHAYTLNAQNKLALQILRTITSGTESFSEKESAVILLKKLEQ
ncbi:MAG: tetratricopeptide repeat protein [Methylococcaceae bacterium]|nr:tetratricopeptide repeat protein [Methylococcaceae bacterium]